MHVHEEKDIHAPLHVIMIPDNWSGGATIDSSTSLKKQIKKKGSTRYYLFGEYSL